MCPVVLRAAGRYYFLQRVRLWLGAADSARLSIQWNRDGLRTVDGGTPPRRMGRGPNGGPDVHPQTSSTKGAANDCSSASRLKIHEVESTSEYPVSWVELYNPSDCSRKIRAAFSRTRRYAHKLHHPGSRNHHPGRRDYILAEAHSSLVWAARTSAPAGSTPMETWGLLYWTAHARRPSAAPNGSGDSSPRLFTKGSANACPGVGLLRAVWRDIQIVEGRCLRRHLRGWCMKDRTPTRRHVGSSQCVPGRYSASFQRHHLDP